MSAARSPLPSWGFVAGLSLLFGGFLANVVSTAGLAGQAPGIDPVAQRPQLYLTVIGAVAMFVGGTQLAARSTPGGMWPVFVVLAPGPGLLALAVSGLGHHLRTARSSGVVRAILAGVGVYLLVLAGQWLAAGWYRAGVADDFRVTGWAIALQVGLSALLLAVTPGGPAADEPVVLAPAAG